MSRVKRIFRRVYEEVLMRLDRERYVRRMGVSFGDRCRFGRDIIWGSEPYLISLGDHVTITNRVVFISHDGGVWVARDEHPQLNVFGRITIKDNSFVGIGVIILPGVTIGKNCVIGAGSVVTRDIPDDSIAAGVPCKVIRSTTDYIDRMLNHSGRVDTKGMSYAEQKRVLLEEFKEDAS